MLRVDQSRRASGTHKTANHQTLSPVCASVDFDGFRSSTPHAQVFIYIKLSLSTVAPGHSATQNTHTAVAILSRQQNDDTPPPLPLISVSLPESAQSCPAPDPHRPHPRTHTATLFTYSGSLAPPASMRLSHAPTFPPPSSTPHKPMTAQRWRSPFNVPTRKPSVYASTSGEAPAWPKPAFAAAFFLPLSCETSRGWALVALKRVYLKSVAKGPAIL